MNFYHDDDIPDDLKRYFKPAPQIGMEPTPDEHVAKLVEVFREVRRVLRNDGVLWLNYGDAYASNGSGSVGSSSKSTLTTGSKLGSWAPGKTIQTINRSGGMPPGLKPKDLIGLPWMLAFALRADGWWLRSDIIWCLSGGTWLYVRTQKGDMPMTVKDVARLDPSTVQLWNGTKWTRLLGMNKSPRRGDELEIVLRSGERISCTPTHRFPTTAGLTDAADLKAGDVLMRCRLPEPEATKDCAIDEDAAWFAGLYVAEGSRSGDTIQIAGHAKESERWDRVQRIAAKFGGSATMDEDGNNQAIRVYGKMLNAILAELVTGRTSHDKGFAPVVWRYSDRFIAAMVDGYLSGDGHADGSRWRLGFCRNYNLERDLRTACARLGYTLTLNLSSVEYDGRRVPTFRGELRKERSGHHNERDRNEIVEIRKSRCRDVYDLGVEDEPHLFALASGVLTHNSKPNPMPESVTDRPTRSHEYVFLLTKAARYYYDAEAIREATTGNAHSRRKDNGTTAKQDATARSGAHNEAGKGMAGNIPLANRNARTVWTINPQPTPEAHFATFPEALAERCILAGTSAHGACSKCGAPWERIVEKGAADIEHQRACGGDTDGGYDGTATKKYGAARAQDPSAVKARILAGMRERVTTGWKPTCECEGAGLWVRPCVVLDPFAGSGTTLLVAERLGRDSLGIELNPEYVAIAERRIRAHDPTATIELAPGVKQASLFTGDMP